MEELTRERVMEMKVTELRDALGSRNMSKTGNKADLQSRLLEALEDKKEKEGQSNAEEKEERAAPAGTSSVEQDGAGEDDNNEKEKASNEQAELPLTESNLEKQLPQDSGAGVHRYRSTDSCDTSLESRMANIDASSEREEIRSMSSVVGSEDGPNPHRAASVAQSEGEGASSTEVRSVTEDPQEETAATDKPAANAVGGRGKKKGKKADDDDDDAGVEKTSTAAGKQSSQASGSSSSSKPAQTSKPSAEPRKGASKETTAKDSDPPRAHQDTTTKKESDAAPSASRESTTNRSDPSPPARKEAPAKPSNAAPSTRASGPATAPKKLVASAISAATGGVGRTGVQREKELLKELKSKMPPPAVKKASSTAGSEGPKADGGNVGEASAAKGAAAQGGGETQEVPPAQNPVSCTIRVDGFVRPFTLPAAKKLLVEVAGGPMVDDGFWMDAIKTHCYATFGSEEHASRAREALYNRVWPERGGTLKTEFSDKTAAQVCKEALEAKAARANAQATSNAAAASTAAAAAAPQASAVASPRGVAPPTSLSRSASDLSSRTGATGAAVNGGAAETGRRKRELGPSPEPDKRLRLDQSASGGSGIGGGGAAGRPGGAAMPSLDELFRSTKTKPKLYYLPLSEEQVAVKRKQKEELQLKRKEQKRAKK